MVRNKMDNHVAISTPTIDVAYVKNLLKEKPYFNISWTFHNVKANGPMKRTTLALYAVQTNNEELLDYLIDAKVDLNISVSSLTPLIIAINWRSLQFVKKLHQAGANILEGGGYYSTPLACAVTLGNFEITEYLINNGADVNAVIRNYPQFGYTAVLIAARRGYKNIVDLLLKYNAEPFGKIDLSSFNVTGVKNILSTTPNININSIFVCKKSLSHPPTTLAHLAVEFNNEELLDFLIKSNANLNVDIPFQGTVLHVASGVGNLDLVKKLFKFGAKMNKSTEDDYCGTPLFCAVNANKFEITKYLLKKEANPNTCLKKWYSSNVLFLAIKKRYNNIVKLLLENNADPNAKFKGKWTPIMFACEYKNLEAIQILIAYGSVCDIGIIPIVSRIVDLKTLDYLLALDIDVIDYYLTADKSEISVLSDTLNIFMFKRINGVNFKFINVLLDAGVNINYVDNSNKVIVEWSYHFNFVDILKRHIVKLKQVGIYVCQKNIEAVDGKYDNFHGECSREIIELKNNKVGTSNQAFYGVLHKNVHSLAIRLRHTDITDIVDKDKLLNIYPIYGGMIYYKLAKAQRRMALLKNVEEFLDYVLNYCLKLPYTFTRELYMYITNENLKKLSSAHST